MKLHIQNDKVRLNLALIVETIRQKKKLTFSLDQSGLLQPPREGLKTIEIHLDISKHEVRIVEPGQSASFNLAEIGPQGQKVLSETCHYLKEALLNLHEIRELSHLEFDPTLDDLKGRTMLHEAWHAVDREDAERMLLNATPGTYLFRKDRFAAVMEGIIAGARKTRIRCFTLTYLDPERQVRDKTIVTWHDHWLFYDDDPTLSGEYYQTLDELLQTMGTILKRPLPALKIVK